MSDVLHVRNGHSRDLEDNPEDPLILGIVVHTEHLDLGLDSETFRIPAEQSTLYWNWDS